MKNLITCQGGNIGWGDYDHQITWPFSHVIKWQMESFIAAPPQNLQHRKIARWWLRARRSCIPSHLTFDYVVQEKTKILYLDFPNTCSYQTRQSGNFMRGKSFPSSHVSFLPRGHETNEKLYICTYTAPIVIQLVRVVTLNVGITSTYFRDLLITWLVEKWKALYLHFSKTYGNQASQVGDLGLSTCSLHI